MLYKHLYIYIDFQIPNQINFIVYLYYNPFHIEYQLGVLQ